MDATAIYTFKETIKLLNNRKIHVIVTDLLKQPYDALDKSKVLDLIGKENIISTIDIALNNAKVYLETNSQKL